MIAIYCRVSTDEQAKNETVQNQIDFGKKYAELHNLGEIEFFIDEGVSGIIPLEERKDGKRLLDTVHQGLVGEVLLYRLDRLGRSARIILNSVHEIEKFARVKSMTEPFDTHDPTGRFLLTILAGVADLERETIRERTYAGLRRTVARGKWPGHPPLGYQKDKDGLLVPNEELIEGTNITPVELVQLIFRLVGEQQYTTVQVCQYLNALSLPPGVKIQGMGRRKNKNGWAPGYIYNMITNTVYIGTRTFRSKKDEPIVCEVPSIITDELWQKTQTVIKEHSRLNWYKPKYQYLLTGLIRCGICGKIYSGRTVKRYNGQGVYLERSYVCSSKRHSVVRKPCGNSNVSANKIEEYIWGKIVSFIKNPGPELAELMANMPDTNGLAEEAETIKQIAAGKENEKQKILDLYRQGIIPMDDVEEQARRITEEKKALERRQAELKAQIDQFADTSLRIKELHRLIDLLRSKIEKPLSWEGKRQTVMAFIREIIIYPGSRPGEKNHIKIRYFFSNTKDDPGVVNSAEKNNDTALYKLFNSSML
ncbi:MAG: DNA-invertase hin [Pelotomaculum sp. PtaU1.Bin035]|nr:MAG: DNA-invertase hin [Pelotomaculum sp. PtaU1.Bin035]